MAAVLARGMRGDIVVQLQTALTQFQVPADGGGQEPALAAIDGDFGRTTQRAVQRAQAKLTLPVTGVVDQQLWQNLTNLTTGEPWPSLIERNMSLLASFEGHGYTIATGNWDGAGITWGIIGFTLIQRVEVWEKKGSIKTKKIILDYGSLHGLLNEALAKYEATTLAAFGVARTEELKTALAAGADDLYSFAVRASDDKHHLRTEWRNAFAVLGRDPDIRELQRAHAKKLYHDPALKEADDFGREFDMLSERTDQLFFDIQVNNGGLRRTNEWPERRDAKAALTVLLTANPKATLTEKLGVITRVLADSRKGYAKDINERKGMISSGFGRVHGKDYRLDGWGIELDLRPTVPPKPPPERIPLRLGVLSVEPVQQAEQLALAAGARQLGLAETGVELVAGVLWPTGNWIEPLSDGKVKSLSLRGLLNAGPIAFSGKGSDTLLHGINLMFREPVGALAVIGQSTPFPEAVSGDHLVVGRGNRNYIGLALKRTDQLHIVRQRERGETRAESSLDITEIRPHLAECRLLMLYSGYGVPYGSLPGSGVRWREWLKPFNASPIVLGWFGNIRIPQDAVGQFVANDFFANVAALMPGVDLATLCEAYPDAIVQQWGAACHRAFHKGPQAHLWRDQAIPALEATLSGAGAIGRDGRIWHANPRFGSVGELAMTAVPF